MYRNNNCFLNYGHGVRVRSSIFAIRSSLKKKKKNCPLFGQNERANERVEEFSLKIERERRKESEPRTIKGLLRMTDGI